MSYDTVTIQKQTELPLVGYALNVQVSQKSGNTYVPTFEKTLVIPNNNIYQIVIQDPKFRVVAGAEVDLDPYITDVEIRVNDINYLNCKRLAGNLTKTNIIDGYTVFTGTIIYKGYIWRRPDGSENTGEL